MKSETTTEQTSERELVTTRIINGPARLVFHEIHTTKEATDEAIGMGEAMHETLGQLDELLATR